MQIIQIDPASIVVGERLRAIEDDRAALLAESVRDRGHFDQPIRVRAGEDGRYTLITGGHRLRAAQILGWPLIDVIPFHGLALEAELMEVEENLIRNELSALDHASFLARHEAIWHVLYPSTKHGGDRRRKASSQDENLPQHPLAERFSTAIAKKLGLSEATIQRAKRRFRELSPTSRTRITGTWLADNGAALDALIGPQAQPRPEAEQQALLDILLAAEGGTRNVAEAERRLSRLPPPDPAEAIRARLATTWGKAPLRLRSEFLNTLLDDAETRSLIERLIQDRDEEIERREARLVGALGAGGAA